MSFHRVGVPEGIVSELVYVQELWRKRAEVAQECADELGELGFSLGSVVSRNYFGSGCVEGAELYRRLRDVVAAGAAELTRLGQRASVVSSVALSAVNRIESADDSSADDVG